MRWIWLITLCQGLTLVAGAVIIAALLLAAPSHPLAVTYWGIVCLWLVGGGFFVLASGALIVWHPLLVQWIDRHSGPQGRG